MNARHDTVAAVREIERMIRNYSVMGAFGQREAEVLTGYMRNICGIQQTMETEPNIVQFPFSYSGARMEPPPKPKPESDLLDFLETAAKIRGTVKYKLADAGICTMADLRKQSVACLIRLPGIGQRTAEKITQALSAYP